MVVAAVKCVVAEYSLYRCGYRVISALELDIVVPLCPPYLL